MGGNSEEKLGSSRRHFLKKSGAVTVGFVAHGLLDRGASAQHLAALAEKTGPIARQALFFRRWA